MNLKIRKVLIKVITLIVLSVIFIGCEKDNSVNEFEFENFKNEYNLKDIKNENIIKFNSIEEAKLFLEKIKNKKKESHEISFNVKSLGENSFSFSYRDKNFNHLRLRSGSVEETPWNTSTDAGFFSDWELDFNTSGNNVIDKSSISLSTSGFRIGWSYTQKSVTMLSDNSFLIKGNVSVGIGVEGATVGYDERFDVIVTIDWSTRTAHWEPL